MQETETQIALKVAENIPKEEPTTAETPVVTKPEPQLSAFETSVELNDPAISLQIADYMDVPRLERLSEERQVQMRLLYRWGAEQAGATDVGSVLDKIRVLETELGVRYKPDRLTILSRWVKLNNQAQSLRKEMEALHGNALPTGF